MNAQLFKEKRRSDVDLFIYQTLSGGDEPSSHIGRNAGLRKIIQANSSAASRSIDSFKQKFLTNTHASRSIFHPKESLTSLDKKVKRDSIVNQSMNTLPSTCNQDETPANESLIVDGSRDQVES